MAQVVAGFACSHVPFMAVSKNWEWLGEEERTNLRDGFDRARQQLEAAHPDVLITFADDHFDRCFYDNLPAFLVGVGEKTHGPAVADFGLPQVALHRQRYLRQRDSNAASISPSQKTSRSITRRWPRWSI